MAKAKAKQDEPKFIDPMELLLVAELRLGAKLVGADLTYAARNRDSEYHADAVAVSAWLLERRQDMTLSVDEFRRLTLIKAYTRLIIAAGNPESALADVLGYTPDDDDAPPTVEPNAVPGEPVEDPSPPTS